MPCGKTGFPYFSLINFPFPSFENGRIYRFSAIETSQHLNPVKLTIEIINAISHQEPLTPMAFHHLFTHLFSHHKIISSFWKR
jgi:hypothetical protein